MSSPTTTCRRCVEPVNADANACPSCGFDPVRTHRGRMRAWGALTAFLAFTVVGLPLALVTGLSAWNHRREIKRGVAE